MSEKLFLGYRDFYIEEFQLNGKLKAFNHCPPKDEKTKIFVDDAPPILANRYFHVVEVQALINEAEAHKRSAGMLEALQKENAQNYDDAVTYKREWESCVERYDYLKSENAELRDELQALQFNLEQKPKEIGRAEHRGNTVDYIYDKCALYGRQLSELTAKVEAYEKVLEFVKLNTNFCPECEEGGTPPWCEKYCEIHQKCCEALESTRKGK
jgi:DNA repair ATPase RecN